MTPPLRLIADIGATHARVAISHEPGVISTPVVRYRSADYPDLAALIAQALRELDSPPPQTAICALASPDTGDRIRLTNLAWDFSCQATRQALGLSRLSIVNDWVAQGYAIAHLPDGALHGVQHGKPIATAPRLALGPGTGLGTALITPTQVGWQVWNTQGGHISFAPQTDREAALVAYLTDRFGHCSGERMASGLGLGWVYAGLCALDGVPPQALAVEAPHVTAKAQAGDPLSQEALALFTQAFGSIAGDLALACGARGGVYLGGGVLSALGATFDERAFAERFADKGRFAEYLQAIPITQIRHPHPALIGLAAMPEPAR